MTDHMVRVYNIAVETMKELEKAIEMHDPMKSEHEGYAVILEELDELWLEVKKKQRSYFALRKEALQVAAGNAFYSRRV